MLRVALNQIYPDYYTYVGQVGYARVEYRLSKSGIPFIDQWVKNTAIDKIEAAIAQEAGTPLQILILYEDRGSYWKIEVRQWVYDPGWTIQVVETAVIVSWMLKILLIVGIAFTLWALSQVIHETSALVWGPDGNGGLPLIPIAVILFSTAIFVTAVTKFSERKGD